MTMACGGLFQSSDAGSEKDAASDGALAADGGWTMCEAPSGVSICGGPNLCGAQCKVCFKTDGTLSACGDVNYQFIDPNPPTDTLLCPDGALNACDWDEYAPECFAGSCVTEDLPKLYLANGRPDLAKYADRSTYTGDPLPTPASCPSMPPGLSLCGGACGSVCWGGDERCTGRSPLHPYSMCVPKQPTSFPCARGNNGYCNSVRSGFMCLTYEVDQAAQLLADQNSLCVPSTLCQAAAQSYPGGAFCTAGN